MVPMVPPEPTCDPPEPSSRDEAPGPAAAGDPWLADLASLAKSGRLSEGVLANLPWKAMGEQAGSWLDPLFKGPAPIAELQGLGERYTQLQVLGEGASGTVFKALDTLLQRWVALKVLKGESAQALVEARAQAQVEHSNVCRVYEVGRGFIVMQLVEGPTLAAMGPSFDLRTKIACLRDIADGVHAAHQRGLLHLDLKLNNILLQCRPDGTHVPIVSDFGMVLNHSDPDQDACPMGTPPYSSPEQLAGRAQGVGPASDVYSLGIMAYILLCGVSPFEARTLPELLIAIVQAQPVPLATRIPGFPKDLGRLIDRCLHKEPALRCGSAGTLAEELDRFLARKPLLVMGGALPYRARRCAQRNRFTTWALALGLTAVALTVGAGSWREARIAQRTDWDRHFQKRVEEARVALERAYRRPLHDIRPELAQIQRIEDDIRQEMGKGGRLATGPAHLALGQLMVLRDSQSSEAARQFQAAWDAGLRTEGSRTWLAFALLRQYQDALQAAQEQRLTGPDVSLAGIRARYLEPARRMLDGRADSDQVRLRHLADLVETQVAESGRRPGFRADTLPLAVAYRQHLPQDLDALVEELDARLANLRNQLALAHSGHDPERLAGLWKPLAALLQEGLAVAPSHPGIYSLLTSATLLKLDHPFLDPAPKLDVIRRCREWIDLGLRVKPDHPRLLAARVRLLSQEGLEGVRPLGRVHGEMLQALSVAGKAKAQVLFGIVCHVVCGPLHGQDLLPFGLEALKLAQAEGPIPEAPLYANALANHVLGQGQDPCGVFQSLGGDLEPRIPWAQPVLETEFMVQTGRGAQVDVARLEGAFAAGAGMKSVEILVNLERARLLSQTRGSGADWDRFREAFARVQRTEELHQSDTLFSGPGVVSALALAERAHAVGQEPVTYLAAAQAMIKRMPEKTLLTRLSRELLGARFCLGASRCGLASPETLREGVAHLDFILATIEGDLPFSDQVPVAFSIPGRGPLLALRGELNLRLAEGLAGSPRRQAARRARADLDRALDLCPPWRSVLAPLRDAAANFR